MHLEFELCAETGTWALWHRCQTEPAGRDTLLVSGFVDTEEDRDQLLCQLVAIAKAVRDA
jgi:hypothetical protein